MAPVTQMKRLGAGIAVLVVAAAARADEVGYDALVARLGAATPTGALVRVVQTEAPASGAYSPDQTNAEFAGKTFTLMSGASGVSSHATEVGREYYGSALSMAPGTVWVYLYEAASFAQTGYLRLGQGTSGTGLPSTPPGGARVFNHSWIGAFGGNNDNEVLRRADYAMNRDATLFICGENNGTGSAMQPLMSECYNGLAVGLTNGQHSAGPTPTGIDGVGRQKPEIVAPGQYTSFSTPIVSAAATLLYETAITPPLDTVSSARKGVVIKSTLLAGAKHRDTWTNNAPQSGTSRGIATTPMDPVYGVDTVNIDRSHRILTGGRTVPNTSVGTAALGTLAGWTDYSWAVGTQGTSVYVKFHLPDAATTASVVCTWNRYVGTAQIPGAASAPPLANLDVTLYSMATGAPMPLTGSAGIGVFSAGNCASQSTVDNVEHLFLRNLAAGDYLLEVKRMDANPVSAPASIAWLFDVPPLEGDFDGDWIVNGTDLGLLLGSWGQPGPTDLDDSGTTDGQDLGVLLGHWSN